jgi:predicted nucleotidyltransferase
MNFVNEDTRHFLEELKQKPGVLGVLLFGSWAQGNNRPDSDVDLVVILKEGYKRAVEYRNRQVFEIIYTTADAAFEYWSVHRDDGASLWEVAKILHDKDGTMQRLEGRVKELLSAGKKPIETSELGHLRFDIEDQLKYVEIISDSDPTTANLMLTSKVNALAELFFDIRQMWTPAPKQRLAIIREIDPDFHSLLQQLFREQVALNDRLQIARRMVPRVFDR